EEVRQLSSIERLLAFCPRGEQLLPAALELPVQRFEEGQRVPRENLLGALGGGGQDVQGHAKLSLPGMRRQPGRPGRGPRWTRCCCRSMPLRAVGAPEQMGP